MLAQSVLKAMMHYQKSDYDLLNLRIKPKGHV
jgi:hypothetical protein